MGSGTHFLLLVIHIIKKEWKPVLRSGLGLLFCLIKVVPLIFYCDNFVLNEVAQILYRKEYYQGQTFKALYDL